MYLLYIHMRQIRKITHSPSIVPKLYYYVFLNESLKYGRER